MPVFNWLQKKIAHALLSGSKDIEELSKIVGENPLEIEKALKQMVELKVVNESAGMFSLAEEVRRQFHEREDLREKEKLKLDLQAFIEISGISKKAVSKQLVRIEDALKANPSLVLYSIEHAEPAKHEELYTSHIELTFGVKDFPALIDFMYFYGPTAIEVIRPAKVEFTAYEIQEGLNEMADLIFKYNNYIAVHLKKAAIDEFYRKLFQGKKK